MNWQQRLYFRLPVPVQNALVSAYGFHLRHKRYAGSQSLERRAIEATMWSADRIADYHASTLRRMLDYAATLDHYRQVFASAGFLPSDFRSIDDLVRLPLLRKEVVRNHAESMRPHGKAPYWIQHTSGTTGTPVVVHVDRQTYQLVHILLRHHERLCGVLPSDLRATFAGRMIQPPDHLTPPFWRYNRADRQLLFSAYHLSEDTLPAYVRELQRCRPAELIGYPSAIATVARYLLATGAGNTIRPKVVITNSETLFEWQRAAIEAAFGCPVRDYYGTAEAVVFAAQCPAGTYHFHPLLGIAEVVDRQGRTVAPGQTGRLVCTTLTNRAQPLIRYVIGDEAVSTVGSCTCGSALPGARSILGRSDDVIVTPDGRHVGRMDHIFKGALGIKECQIVQEALDHLRLLLVADAGFTPAQEQQLRDNIRERLGDTVRVTIEPVHAIQRTHTGKFRGVVSRVITREQS